MSSNNYDVNIWGPEEDELLYFPDDAALQDILSREELERDYGWAIDQMFEQEQYGGAINVGEQVTVEKVAGSMSRKFRLFFDRYKVSLRDSDTINPTNTINTIIDILDHILQEVLRDVAATDRVRLRIESPSLQYPIYTPVTQRDQLSVERWMLEVERVLNSFEEFRMDQRFFIMTEYAKVPTGGCLDKVSPMLRQFFERKQAVIQIKNSDGLCLARGMVVGKALANGDKKKYNQVRKPKSREQTKQAKELMAAAGLPERECTLADVYELEKVLVGYQVKIFSTDHLNACVHKGPPADKIIMLLHSDGHFNVLSSLSGFFERNSWCHTCDKGYDHRTEHRCCARCPMCLRADCPRERDDPKYCGDCFRTFHGQSCYDEHKAGPVNGPGHARRALCDVVSRCEQCSCTVSQESRKPNNPHQCGEILCKTCHVFDLPASHKCWMVPRKFSGEEMMEHENARFLYFDFETWVDQEYKLSPNLVVVQDDQGTETVFPKSDEPLGHNITEDLCAFFFQPKHKNFYIIAHNLRAFDGYFVLNWVVKSGMKHKIIMNGGKILQMDITSKLNIRFRDSLNFNPQSLAKWPATFGIENTSKGTFPHKFNRPENWNQPAPLPFPSLAEFDYEAMHEKEKPAFLQWYEAEKTAKGNVYDFRKEFEEYCRNDVTVLRRCCQQFRKLFMEISGGLCPFVSALTIAGLCGVFWRARMLQEKQIGLIPQRSDNRFQSKAAIKWMEWEADQRHIDIQHKGNHHREHKIGSRFVDGFCEATNTVFEFHGCYFHGCPRCTNPQTLHPYQNILNGQVHADTLAREQYLRDQHVDLVVMWECDFRSMMKTDLDLKQFLSAFSTVQPLMPRDAFYGGRTNAIKLHHVCAPGEKIRYYDVTSEYPYVNKNKKYPIGHHERITKNFADFHDYFGLIYCQVLPPRQLNIPVLPARFNKKLTFALCRTCAELQHQGTCDHSEDQRVITGTWCTPEVEKALQRGYQLRRIYEVWHFPQTQERLFEDYVNCFLKIKTEASGWPADCTTEADRDNFLQQFDRKEGIQLDRSKITVNPGLRSLAKLCLNSFWGRFGMKEDRTNTMFIHDVHKFQEMLLSGKHCVKSWDMFNDDVIQIQYKSEEGFEEQNPTVNCVIAAFTTCWARLHLLKFMEEIEEAGPDRILYHDTDSVIFVSQPDIADPATGNFLGDLTDELKPGQFIQEFVSLGPKTYAYQTNDGKTCVKVKGFTLNDTLKRNKRQLELTQVPMMYKRCKVTFDKRFIVDDEFNTRPYGYCL